MLRAAIASVAVEGLAAEDVNLYRTVRYIYVTISMMGGSGTKSLKSGGKILIYVAIIYMSEVAELPQQQQQQQQQQNGGAGAAEWAIDRAGGIGQQQPVSNIDNTIALKGGRRRRRKSTKCGGGRARRGKSRKNTSRRSRKGTRRH